MYLYHNKPSQMITNLIIVNKPKYRVSISEYMVKRDTYDPL